MSDTCATCGNVIEPASRYFTAGGLPRHMLCADVVAERDEADALRFQKDALIAERDALIGLLPETWYAGCDGWQRLDLFVKHWQRVVEVGTRLEEERDEAVRLLRLTKEYGSDAWQTHPYLTDNLAELEADVDAFLARMDGEAT